MRSAAVALACTVAACVLLAGCASRTAGQPVAGGTSLSGPVTSSGADVTGTPQVSYDSSADAVVIHLGSVAATVAGEQGQSGTTLYGDGRVVRVEGDGTRVVARISAQSVGELAGRAAALLDAPDPGSPVTDVGSTSITVTVNGRTATLTMGDIPSGMDLDLDPDVQRTRDTIDAVSRALWTLEGLDVVDQPSTLPPASTSPTTSPAAPSTSPTPTS